MRDCCQNHWVSTLAVLQARMSSSRLPGKVMLPLLGQPMIGRQIERIRRARLIDELVVATSTDPADDVLADYVGSLGVAVVRGPLDDVLARFVLAIEQFEPDAVVRLTADCPLTSPAVIDQVIEQFLAADVDYCSNTLQPTYPDGLDTEVVRPAALLAVAAGSVDVAVHEHVTLGVYRRAELFSLANVRGEEDLADLRWTVETPEDFAFVEEVYAALYPSDPLFDLPEILQLLEERPALVRSSADEVRNAALIGLDTGAMHA